jgi:hypothetical protein
MEETVILFVAIAVKWILAIAAFLLWEIALWTKECD